MARGPSPCRNEHRHEAANFLHQSVPLLALPGALWEVEQAGAWCFERPNDDDDDGEEPVDDEPEPVAADAEDEEDACGDDEMAADDE